MSEPFKKIKSVDNPVWITQPNENQKILQRKSVASNITKGKIVDTDGRIETAILTAEDFKIGLFKENIKKKSKEWTIKQWVEPVIEKIFNLMKTAATFTEITEDDTKSFMFRYSLDYDESIDTYLLSLFIYDFLQGIFISAYSNGKLIMKRNIAKSAPIDEFTFKTNTINEDKFENERIKKYKFINEA